MPLRLEVNNLVAEPPKPNEITIRVWPLFYEIGIAHTLRKDTILIAQTSNDVPFDLRRIRVIHYHYTPHGMSEFEDQLRRTVLAVPTREAPPRRGELSQDRRPRLRLLVVSAIRVEVTTFGLGTGSRFVSADRVAAVDHALLVQCPSPMKPPDGSCGFLP